MPNDAPRADGARLIAAATALLAVPVALGAVVASRGEFMDVPGLAVGLVAISFVPAAAVVALMGTVAGARTLRASVALRTPRRVAVTVWGATLTLGLIAFTTELMVTAPRR